MAFLNLERSGSHHRQPFEHTPGKVPPSTRATVRFHAGTTDNKPATIEITPGRQHQTNIKPGEEVVVDVIDLRFFDPPVTLAVDGCEWVHSPTTLDEADLLDEDNIKAKSTVEGTYYNECAKLVQQRTGASKALAHNWRYRQHQKDFIPSDVVGISFKPVTMFHIDNDKDTAEASLRRTLGDAEAERWLKKHWGIINVWRPVGDTVMQWPLGLMDSRGVKVGEDAEPIFTKNNYKSHFLGIKHTRDFNFYYVSKLTVDEALLFVDYDSAKSEELSGLAHGAFYDHGTPEDAPLRRSMEVRVLVLWDEEA